MEDVKIDESLDTLQEEPTKSLKWTNVENVKFPYNHRRPLSQKNAQKALDYIAVLTKQYPFQIRWAMAVPLWKRFAEAWCETGDIKESLRVI